MKETAARLQLMEDTGFLLSRSSGLAVRTTNSHLARFGLRVRQYSVLSVACDRNGITQRELAEVLGLDPSQIVALVDELEAEGLVERRPDPRDRRTRLVSATRRGRFVRKKASAATDDSREQFLAPLGLEDRAVLHDLLRRLVVQAADDAGVMEAS